MKRLTICTKTKTKAMKKISLVLVLYCTFNLLSFTACSPGYGCTYAVSETTSETSESLTVKVATNSKTILSDELNCLP